MTKKVLVVDDDPDVVKLLKTKLEAGSRYAVTTATDGETAVRLATTDRPDLILCDIDMPDMDGVEVAESLARDEKTKSIPLIFLSALVTPADMKRGVAAGHRMMLAKSAPIAELTRTIDDLMG